jgi:hypothetical protein
LNDYDLHTGFFALPTHPDAHCQLEGPVIENFLVATAKVAGCGLIPVTGTFPKSWVARASVIRAICRHFYISVCQDKTQHFAASQELALFLQPPLFSDWQLKNHDLP